MTKIIPIHKKYVMEIVRDLREISGRNDKIAYLTEALAKNRNFKKAAQYAYNPYNNYYLSSTDQLLQFQNKTRFGSPRGYREIDHIWPVLDSINDHGSCPARLKQVLFNHLCEVDDIDVEAIDLVLKGSFDCGINTSSINKACPGLIPTFKASLCAKLTKKALDNITYPAYAQLKMDAMRAFAFVEKDKIVFRSRNGKELTTHSALDADLFKMVGHSANTVIDGELMTVNSSGQYNSRKVSNGICNKAIRGTISEDEADQLVFVVWDIISTDTFWAAEGNIPYRARFDLLTSLINQKSPEKIKLVESMEVEDYHEVNKYFMKTLERGEEGIILKNINANYQGKRTTDCIKFKAEKTADLIITEVLEGAGKYSGQLGSFRCTTSDGDLNVNVGTGFSDQHRSDYFTNSLVGKIIEVKYNEVIEDKFGDKSLFLPVFVDLRPDKDEANDSSEL